HGGRGRRMICAALGRVFSFSTSPRLLLPSAAHPQLKSQTFTKMAANKKLLILPGDGIGVEVMGEVERLLGWFDKKRALRFDTESALCGGAAIDKEGKPISDATVK